MTMRRMINVLIRIIVKNIKHRNSLHSMLNIGIQQRLKQINVCQTCCNVQDCRILKLIMAGKRYSIKNCKYMPAYTCKADELPIIAYSIDINNLDTLRKYRKICKASTKKLGIIKKEPKAGK